MSYPVNLEEEYSRVQSKTDINFRTWKNRRTWAQTDLWYLTTRVLTPFNGNSFSEVPHKEMCEFYVKKDPEYPTFREFSQAYAGSHDRIMLVPRQSRKSGIKIIDNVQWIICWPEIRIMTLTSTNDLSTAFINQLIDYFVVKGKAKRNRETNRLEGGSWSDFQILFPEHCISESERTLGEYTTPLRAEPGANFGVTVATAGTLSMEASTSGWRCDIMDNDDPVSDRNAESSNLLEKLDTRIAMIYELLMSHGFRHWVATRYDLNDPYGKLLEQHGIKGLYGDYESQGLKAMMRPCWWLKGSDYGQPDYKAWTPSKDDLTFFYPDGPPFETLVKKMKKPKVFSSQQLNNPEQQLSVQFTGDLVRSCFVDHSALPKEGITFASWDFAYGQGKTEDEDHSCGVVGLLDNQRRWWITDLIYDRFTFTEKCYQVVKTIRDARPRRTCIEDTPGLQGAMEDPIARHAMNFRIPLNIDWIPHHGQKDAKYIRICAIHPWMMEHRIFFLNNLLYLDDLVREFKNTRSMSKLRNDIPDAIARLVAQYTQYAVEIKAPTQTEYTRQFLELAERDFHNLMHRTGPYAEGGAWDQGQWSRDYRAPVAIGPEPLDPDSPSYALDALYRDIE